MSAPLLVADSGPLIALARLDLLELPSRLFEGVLVTATVWEEVARGKNADEVAALAKARTAAQFSVVADPAEIPASLLQTGLDAGELSAVVLALERQATVLMDERRGRQWASSVGLPVVGTLGLLVRARESKLIDNVRSLTDRLLTGGYFLAPKLVEQALAAVGE